MTYKLNADEGDRPMTRPNAFGVRPAVTRPEARVVMLGDAIAACTPAELEAHLAPALLSRADVPTDTLERIGNDISRGAWAMKEAS